MSFWSVYNKNKTKSFKQIIKAVDKDKEDREKDLRLKRMLRLKNLKTENEQKAAELKERQARRSKFKSKVNIKVKKINKFIGRKPPKKKLGKNLGHLI